MLGRLTRWLGESDSLLNRPKWLTCGVRSNICLEVKNLQSETYLERKGLTGKNLILCSELFKWSEAFCYCQSVPEEVASCLDRTCAHAGIAHGSYTQAHTLSTEEYPVPIAVVRDQVKCVSAVSPGSRLCPQTPNLSISIYLYWEGNIYWWTVVSLIGSFFSWYIFHPEEINIFFAKYQVSTKTGIFHVRGSHWSHLSPDRWSPPAAQPRSLSPSLSNYTATTHPSPLHQIVFLLQFCARPCSASCQRGLCSPTGATAGR